MNLSHCNILAVDDTAANLDLIVETLGKSYEIAVATDGPTALEYIKESPPDLILLDIMMPGMDGYQVCEQLKADEASKDIPVVFLTSLSEEMNEEKGLAMGAVDYIVKPFSPEIMKARVRNQLLLKLQHDELVMQNEILKENTQLKEDIEAITRHDLKSPLNGIIGYPSIILGKADLDDKSR